MDYEQIMSKFRIQQEFADFIGADQGTISRWKRNGIPLARQFQIEEMTNGELRADRPWKRKSK